MSLSRRDLLKRLGVASSAAIVPLSTSDTEASPGQSAPTPPRREALETLTAAEAEILEAAIARIIPSDETGPGARDARAAHYIDRALAGALSSSRAAYAAGLVALDAYARNSKGSPFAQLSAGDQDAILADVQSNTATGFTPSGAAFFNLLRAHTVEGTFSDPYYGGNANFVGWDLIGYPGVRVAVTAAEQNAAATVAPNHKSAYDFPMFTGRSGNHDGQ